jgi:septal ring factor EnvC (AmiA/AmiB activator)
MTFTFFKKHLPVVLPLALAIWTNPFYVHAEPATKIKEQLTNQQNKNERINKGIESQKTRVKAARDHESSLLNELETIDRHIAEDSAKLIQLKTSLTEHEKRISEKQEEIKLAQQAKEGTKKHTQKRLSAFYRMGPMGVMNVMFSSSKLPDLLTFREYFDTLLKYDQQVIKEYRQKIEILSKAQQSLQDEKTALLATITEVKEQESMLAATRKDRLALLERVKTEKTLYKQALKELEKAANRLTDTLQVLKKEAVKHKKVRIRRVTAKKKRPTNFGFAKQKGKLNPPVYGTVTTLFGKNAEGKFGITTFANGIDIKTKPNTQIQSIYDGKVVYAGFLRGYGNLLIVDHGDQYYTLMSRAEKFFKQEGDSVIKGEVVGTMSSQTGLLSEGLHFELRHGTTPINPLLWVNNAKLTVTIPPKTNN